jgi:hypothetical protein
MIKAVVITRIRKQAKAMITASRMTVSLTAPDTAALAATQAAQSPLVNVAASQFAQQRRIKENSPGAAVPASFPLSPEDFNVMSTSVNQRRSLVIAQFHELRLDDRCPSTRRYFRMKLPSRPAIIQSVQTHRVKNRKLLAVRPTPECP